jgi:hypothetical protein
LAVVMLAVASITTANGPAHGRRAGLPTGPMLLRTYLTVYFALVASALAALWQSRALDRLPAPWVFIVFAAAVLLGVLLAIVSRSHPTHPA